MVTCGTIGTLPVPIQLSKHVFVLTLWLQLTKQIRNHSATEESLRKVKFAKLNQ